MRRLAILGLLLACACGSTTGTSDPGPAPRDAVVADAAPDPGPADADAVAPDRLADGTGDALPEAAPEAGDLAAEAADAPVEIEPPDRPLCPAVTDAPGTVIAIDPAGTGLVFDGLGAISSAGNSRYLIDYPEPQRSQILDYFFKPGYGASLQVLKVEIAGDMNSTSGSEASHKHTLADVECDRGYQWWMMKEAKARNPSIRLAGLAWGSPGWTLDGSEFYTPALISYLTAWLDCAKTNGLDIDYLGGRNETGWDTDWIEALRAALVKGGYATKLVMADTHQTFGWAFATLVSGDPVLAAALDVVGVHYPCFYDSTDATVCDAPPEVLGLSQPIWASEQGGDPASYGRILTRGYIQAHLTGFHHWPLMASLPDGIPFGDAGLVIASQPWSGTYAPQVLLWTFGHLTHFTQPGWHYLDAASGYPAGDKAQGGFVTLASPDGSRVTTLIETSIATSDQVVELDFPASMPKRIVHYFVSDTTSSDPAAYLVHTCDLDPAAGPVRVRIPPHRLVTMTTTSGDVRGDATGPAPAAFPLPYSNDLESGTPGQEAKFLANSNGAFEIAACGGGRAGQCLRQTAEGKPAFWGLQVTNPLALIGDGNLTDCTITVDAMPEADGTMEIVGRYSNQAYFDPTTFQAYLFRVDTGGAWSISVKKPGVSAAVSLAAGTTAAWTVGTWHTLGFSLSGQTLQGSVDGTVLGTATDATWSQGLAGIGVDGGATGLGWHHVQFDNLSIAPVAPPTAGPRQVVRRSPPVVH
jgi:O-glycosyl hydrolase